MSFSERILFAVERRPIVNLADLRRSMTDMRSADFDALILCLADAGRLVLVQDISPEALDPDELAGCVRDGECVFTMISRRQ